MTRWWRRVRRWWHNRYGLHGGVFIAKYGRVCPTCHLPVRWESTTRRYVPKEPLTLHPPIGRAR